jgi:hypothetical protein
MPHLLPPTRIMAQLIKECFSTKQNKKKWHFKNEEELDLGEVHQLQLVALRDEGLVPRVVRAHLLKTKQGPMLQMLQMLKMLKNLQMLQWHF